jgi:tRNA modification GTPase
MPSVAKPSAIAGHCWLHGIAAPLPGELYLWPGSRSYTGQPVAEIHTLGSPPLLDALLRTLCASGARPAEPGEFTLRAFLAGRIDLTQAEAVLGVIDATDSRQLHAALAQLAGGLAQPLHRLRDALLDLLANVEAGLDFADDDLPTIARGDTIGQLDAAAATIARLLEQMDSRQESAESVRAALVGLPNSGKSSLFNALAGGPVALVSDRPGATRDYLTADLDLAGLACQLIDTAGIDAAGDCLNFRLSENGTVPFGTTSDIHLSAQTAAHQQHRRADVRVLCVDASGPLWDWGELLRLGGAGEPLVALTKTDLPRHRDFSLPPAATNFVETSSLTGEGIAQLRELMRRAAIACRSGGGDVVAGTAARCRQSLLLASDCLARAQDITRDGAGDELAAAELRVALEEIGKVAGAVYTDDVLDRIFSRFCIGK